MEPAFQFTETYLGPACAIWLQKDKNAALVSKWIDQDVAAEDAVLRGIFGEVSQDQELFNEFLNYFMEHLLKSKIVNVQPSLRRMVDSDDLVQSVFAEIWGNLPDFEFTTRGAFISLLSQRMKWKASNESRRMRTQKRREDLRASTTPEEIGVAINQPGPLTENLSKEERDQMAIAVFRLPPRDRQIVMFSLNGFSHAEIAERMGLEVSTARKALNRAVSRMRADIHSERILDME
ncbi:MAG TPA: sigma-70 family RNA polymerase sigma factor [Planctomycetota bacterium]|jgi:RNA polymerase sigma factor (sigma-70 family)|nr:hypothetical protein [Planctomycetota bacterium]MDP6128544.1 sigma-70 family RNA polymerase sigma factor [Planctomycetota bacterium]MDP7245512.1 sigma-70 family RNA polymerase sigma factor [Planctomycetota bacterium]HJM40119.1 sigma-70 family RNA polymerase sigma factor [Planctomycetota bacterium]|tara:strand:+ start:28912 stop:29616 length:705 start_codon:yes stop_codon:yes gene_type:complete